MELIDIDVGRGLWILSYVHTVGYDDSVGLSTGVIEDAYAS